MSFAAIKFNSKTITFIENQPEALATNLKLCYKPEALVTNLKPLLQTLNFVTNLKPLLQT
jgi:hypothetical protein